VVRRYVLAIALAALALGGLAGGVLASGVLSGSNQPPLTPGVDVTPSAPVLNSPQESSYVAALWQADQNNGNLSGGCAAIQGQQWCVPAVAVDGKRIPDIAILNALVGVSGSDYPVGSTAALHAAVAEAVLRHLLTQQGIADGLGVTTTAATAYAQQQLADYQQIAASDPTEAQAMLPSGVSAKDYLLNPYAITQYQAELTAAAERRALLGAAGNGAAHRPVFVTFLQHELTNHTVTVNGSAPGFDPSAELPSQP